MCTFVSICSCSWTWKKSTTKATDISFHFFKCTFGHSLSSSTGIWNMLENTRKSAHTKRLTQFYWIGSTQKKGSIKLNSFLGNTLTNSNHSSVDGFFFLFQPRKYSNHMSWNHIISLLWMCVRAFVVIAFELLVSANERTKTVLKCIWRIPCDTRNDGEKKN